MPNILVVDDEIGIRELFSEILSDEGFTVTVAANSAEARHARQMMNFDVILLDIWMPDTDGMTLLKEWASQGELPCPIIMMSGHANIDMAVEATKFGAFTFLEKPTSMRDLIETVHNALHAGQQKTILSPQKKEVEQQETLQEKDEKLQESLRHQIDFTLPLREAREQFERAYFTYLLEKENHSMTRIASRAQLERTHLYRKLRQLGIEWSKED